MEECSRKIHVELTGMFPFASTYDQISASISKDHTEINVMQNIDYLIELEDIKNCSTSGCRHEKKINLTICHLEDPFFPQQGEQCFPMQPI